MKVLFVSAYSPNKSNVSAFISSQYKSLIKAGLDMDTFYYHGGSIKKYISAIPKLNKKIKAGNYDIIHCHYTFSGVIASFQSYAPVVLSLMGSDVLGKSLKVKLVKNLSTLKAKQIIAKSPQLKNNILFKSKTSVIPNGVNFDRFFPIKMQDARKQLNLPTNQKILLFVANPKRPEKNFTLANNIEKKLQKDNKNVKVIVVCNCSHEKLNTWYNAANFLLLTSKYEGSPNVVKEALATNLPVISTNVGDVKHIIKGFKNCYILSHNISNDVKVINSMLNFEKNINYREKIAWLEEQNIAKKIIQIYKKALK